MPDREYPTLQGVVLDATQPRPLAEFYRQLLGYEYRAGYEPTGGEEPEKDWLVLEDPAGRARLAFQQVERLTPSTWPDDAIPQQLHLDFGVPTKAALVEQHKRALALGARVLEDRFDSVEEPLYVYADPAGHPFCIFVSPVR